MQKPLAFLLSLLPLSAPLAQGQPSTILDDAWVEKLDWRSIGPANMGGRVTAISVYEKDPSLYYVATASGGLLKTVNNGTTFEHQFDHEATVSIGDVCVAQSNSDIVWVGTGEENPRNSVSYGDGVYKSVDGGKTWQNMGLKETFQIGSVVVHPTNPDVVYVGALGRLYGPSEERGLYKTVDGGENWEKILYVDDMTGVMEITMHPADPDTMLVATYERQRDGFDGNPPAKKIAPGSGLYRTTDGGKNFTKLTEGLPTVMLGRIGTSFCAKDPNIVFACIETEMLGKSGENVGWIGADGVNAETGSKLDWLHEEGPAKKAGLQKDDIVISVAGKTVLSNAQMQEQISQHEVGAVVAIEVARKGESHVIEATLAKRPAEGASRPRGRSRRRSSGDERPFGTFLGGQRANVQNQQGKDGHEHGGIYRSADGGTSWERVNSVHARPMYFSQIRVDPSNPDTVYLLGVSAYRSKDGGKTFNADASRGVHSDQHALWIDPNDSRHLIIGSDGGPYVTYDQCANWEHLNHMALGQFYHVAVGPRRDYWVYGGLQDNGTWGAPHRSARSRGPINADWLRIGGGDGFLVRVDENDPNQIYYSSQNGSTQRTHLETQERASLRPRAPEGKTYRFNWETPFLLSHHNSRIYYSAGNYVFRSLDRGNDQKPISPEITRTDRGSATALTESLRDSDVLYVGTDDGSVWGTKDGGKNWRNLWEIPHHFAKAETARVNLVEASLKHGQKIAEVTEAAATEAVAKAEATTDTATEEKPAAAVNAVVETKSDVAVPQKPGTDAPGTDAPKTDAPEKAGSKHKGKKRGKKKGPKPGKPLHELVPGPRWVSSLEASRFADGRCYMTLDAHRSDDDQPYVLATEDHGATWRILSKSLPRGSTKCVREDRENENVLYVGHEFGAWVTIDRGETWTRLNNNLPTVSVHDFAQHKSSGDLVAATHGRSLWVLDVTPLRQMTNDALDAEAHLYEPNDVIVWRGKHRRGISGPRNFIGDNPSNRAQIFYSLGNDTKSVKLEIQDLEGKTIRTLEADSAKGLHRVTWDLRAASNDDDGANRRRRFGRSRTVATGTYRVVLTVDGEVMTRKLSVERDPNFPEGPLPRQDEEESEEEDGGEDRG